MPQGTGLRWVASKRLPQHSVSRQPDGLGVQTEALPSAWPFGLIRGQSIGKMAASEAVNGKCRFTSLLADAVGPEGTVYAVDVDEKKTKKLEKRLGDGDHRNVEVILADDDDPFLPDRSIDIAFLCNTYHHIEDRIAYFRN